MKSNPIIISALVLCMCILHSPTMKAQSVDVGEEMQFNVAILSLINDYELTSMLAESSDKKAFLRLFEHPESPCVYNDIIGSSSFQRIISAKDYVSQIPENGNIVLQTQISDVRKLGPVRSDNGRLYRTIGLKKSVMITDASVYTKGDGAVFFDSSEQFEDAPDFDLEIEFCYNPVRDKCQIVSIHSVENKVPSPFDEGRFSILLKSSEKYDKMLTSRGEPVKFNSFNQSAIYHNEFAIDDEDVVAEKVIEATGDHYNVLSMKYRHLNKRFKIHGGITPGSAYKLESSYEGISSISMAGELGLDFGFESTVKDNWRIGAYVGAAVSMSKLKLSVSDVAYNIEYADKAGKVTQRDYLFSADESLSLKDIVFPVYLENEFAVSKKIVIDFDLGAKIYLNGQTVLSPYAVSGTMGGSNVSKSYTQFLSPANYTRSKFDIAAFASLEGDVCLKPKFLYAYLLLGFESSIAPSYDSGSRLYFSEADNVYPFIYSVDKGTDLPFRSLVGSTVYTRRSLWMSLGLKIKF